MMIITKANSSVLGEGEGIFWIYYRNTLCLWFFLVQTVFCSVCFKIIVWGCGWRVVHYLKVTSPSQPACLCLCVSIGHHLSTLHSIRRKKSLFQCRRNTIFFLVKRIIFHFWQHTHTDTHTLTHWTTWVPILCLMICWIGIR